MELRNTARFRTKNEWAIDSEAMRARGIVVLVKQLVGKKNIETKHLSLVKARLLSFLPPKHYKFGGRFSLLMGYNI